MKKQTAVEWLIEEVECRGIVTKELRLTFEQAKGIEKQQIIDAFFDGAYDADNISGEQYYNKTYRSKGSDATSSQTEISDEEIEEQSWGYREVTKDMEIPPNEDWSNGAKWYREQLKKKS